MKLTIAIYSVILLLVFDEGYLATTAQEPPKIRGRILDERGAIVPNAIIANSWHASETEANSRRGKLPISFTPIEESAATSDAAGEFTLENTNLSLGFLALDSLGEQGAITLWHEVQESDTNEIRLGPLTPITCRIPTIFQSKEIDRIYLTLCLKEVDSQPLAATSLVFISGVHESYAFKLPRGSYRLLVTAITKGNPGLELGLVDDVQIIVNGQPKLDLGELPLRVYTAPELAYVRKVKALQKRYSSSESSLRSKLYDEIAPNWISIDGSGLDHRENLEGLRGKWVLLEFWGLNCVPCLREGIPNLINFYERNEQHRDRFEIVGLFLDFSGEVTSVASLRKKLEPIKANVWANKEIPFPLVLDNTVGNWERYAIQGLGDYLLIDPKGRVTRGDLDTLQRILDATEQPVAP